FAWFLKPAADAHYAGKGIRRNEPDRPIFWYKPEGSDKYRVIYATLAIRNATTPPDVPGAVRVEMPTIDPKADMERVKAENEAFKAWGQAVIKSVPHGEDIIALETLKTLADAMRAAYDDKDRFPGDICDASGKPLLSWRVRLLPYLGKEELYNQFRLDEPWDSKHNRRASIRMPSIYHTPMKGVPHGKTAFLAPNGKGTIFEDQRWLDPKQIADGADSTILLVTADVEHAVPWTKPEDLAIDPVNPALGLRHGHGHFVVAAADGSVWRLPDDLEPARLWGFFSAGGGEKVVWPIATQWPGSDVFFAPKEP
ncbi:MAG TPA: DUF1559 domain-containing protein, partial [Pirellulales bacterium]|nr:DUF1559 domain-containing protein [Pirellulales bacterium]